MDGATIIMVAFGIGMLIAFVALWSGPYFLRIIEWFFDETSRNMPGGIKQTTPVLTSEEKQPKPEPVSKKRKYRSIYDD